MVVSGEGEAGRERDLEALRTARVFVCRGEDMMGEGAWICIDMARVGRAGNGTRPRLMESERGEAVGEDLGVGVARGIRSG